MRVCALITLLVLAPSSVACGQGAGAIRVNQLGYYPGAPKQAAVLDRAETTFHVVSLDLRDTLFTGQLGPAASWAYAREAVRLADFSAFDTPGTYRIAVPGVGASHSFEIRTNVHREVTRGTLKALYTARASQALDAAYAGPWARAAGHPDTEVLIHPSAASPGRPAGATIASSGGWYDAGDYNKYVVPLATSVAHLLNVVQQYPTYAATLMAGIPESGNALPDVLDEAIVGIRWLLTMQDPYDGGVYHKLTTANFQGT
ncbi:MAG: glycoside hydrolase family 9 protein, partial [Bacteroidota bacterium]